MYRLVALARAVDERMWILNRAGRIPFVISGQGHEGAQVGDRLGAREGPRLDRAVLPLDRDVPDVRDERARHHDRPVRDGDRPVVRRAPDARPLRRRREHNLVSVSSPVATQLLHAVGIALAAKIRKTGQVAMTSMGEGSSNQGDVHEGLNFAAIHKLPFVFVVENNGYAISVPASHAGRRSRTSPMRAAGYGIPGVIVDGVRRPRLLRRGARGGRPGPGGRRPDAHRGEGHAADRPLVGRPADEVPLRGGARRRAGARPAAAVPRRSSRRRRPDRGARGAICRRVKAAVDDATDYAEGSRTRPATAMQWVYAEDWPAETPPPWGYGRGRRSTGRAD